MAVQELIYQLLKTTLEGIVLGVGSTLIHILWIGGGHV